MTTPLDWLRRFGDGRNVARGQSLHRYCCSDDEFLALERLLRGTRLKTGAECACFALYASEWLRRRFEGGVWTWQGVFTQLDCSLDHPPYDRMQAALRSHWGLEVIKLTGSRKLLATLLMQGGLPLRVIEREGNAVRTIFRRLLDEAISTSVSLDELTRLAQSWSTTLPQSWRHEAVYHLLAELTEAAATLSARIPEGADPVEYLHENVRGWESHLPLSVTDEVGRALFSFMVKEAHGSAAMQRLPLRIVTQLREVEGSWELVRLVKLPEQLTRGSLCAVLGLDEDTGLPYRVELHAHNERGEEQHIATATLWRQTQEGALYGIVGRGHTRDLAIAGTVEIVGISGSVSFGPAPLDGGEDRGPLPWVFRLPRDETRRWEMVAQGSARLRAPEALLAITNESVVLPDGEGEHVEGGVVGERHLVLVRGRVRVLADGELCRIHLGADSDGVADYAVSGSVIHGLGNGEVVFRGLPTLRASTSGHRYAKLHHGEQQWRAPGGRWRSEPGNCVGKVELRHVVDGATMHIRRWINVVPATFAYLSEPSSSGSMGTLRVSGLIGSLTAELAQDESFTAAKVEDGRGQLTWQIESVGDNVPCFGQLWLNWAEGSSSRLLVPLPIADARFITADGRVLPDKAHVALGEAHRVRAEVIGTPGLVAHARLLLRLQDHQLSRRARGQLATHMPLERVGKRPGFARLDLARVLERVRLRFAASQRPDARIVLELDVPGNKREIRIQRSAYGLSLDRETEELVFEGGELPAGLYVESFPVDRPRAEPCRHEEVSPGRWKIDAALVAHGARLALGRVNGVAQTSTVLLAPPRSQPSEDASPAAEPPEPPDPPSLSIAARQSILAKRVAAFDRIIGRIEQDLDDPDWKLLDDYVATLGDLQPSTFDVIEVLITHPRAVIIALLRAPHRDCDRIWSALESLPFAWHTLPVADWVGGLHAWFEWMSDKLPDRKLPMERIERFRDFAAPRLPSKELVFTLAQAVIDGQTQQVREHLQLLGSPPLAIGRSQERDEAHDQLLRDMAARADVTGNHHYSWPEGPLVGRIVEQAIEALVPDLADLLIPSRPGFRIPLDNAPVLAALWSTAPKQFRPECWNDYTDQPISRRELLFELRRLREQAPHWYDTCFDLTLVEALSRRRLEIFGDSS